MTHPQEGGTPVLDETGFQAMQSCSRETTARITAAEATDQKTYTPFLRSVEDQSIFNTLPQKQYPELRAATPEDIRRSQSAENAGRVNAAIRAEQIDASPAGTVTQSVTGLKLSEAKQDAFYTLWANILESAQNLGSAVIHPVRTLHAIGHLIESPRQTAGQIIDAHHDGKYPVFWTHSLYGYCLIY